jgi:serine protease
MTRPFRRGTALFVEPLEGRDVPALLDFGQLALDHSAYDSTHVLVQWNDRLAHRTYGLGLQAIGNGLYRVNLPANVSVTQAVAALSAQGSIAVAQPDYRVHAAVVPNDPSFGSLWGLDNTGQNGGTAGADIGAPTAWNSSTGTGRTIVAVIDTGVDYTHPDLAANMWRNPGEIPGNGIDDDHNGYRDDVYGYDFANNDPNPMDDNGHGTHVAGTIGAVGGNGIGVAGVDWHAKIMALKFLDSSGSGYLSDAVRALNYAVANGAKVLNNSYGGGGYDATMATAINNARAHGVIIVAAAGNDGTNNDTSPVYPANYAGDNLIAVAATDRNDRLATFSNYGHSTVDIAAPGVSIYSTLPGRRYGTYSGTSMATPHVTGALALVWDAHPNWTYRQVIDAVLNTADPVSSVGSAVAHGRLNVGDAISDLTATPEPNTDTAGPAVTGVTFLGTSSSISKARVTFSEPLSVSSFTAVDVSITKPDGRSMTIWGVAPVAGSNNTQFVVSFPTQTAAGTYTFSLGTDIRDAAGNLLDQNRNGVGGESADRYTTTTKIGSAPQTNTFTSTNAVQPIFDFTQVVSTITVNQDIAIRDLNVRVNVSHSYISDLRMTLVGPDGTRVPLFSRRGGSGDNLTTTFDDEAGTALGQGTAPFAGSFRPESALSALDGKNARGTWQLVVEDVALYDGGWLNGWSITVAGTASAAAAQNLPSAPVSRTDRVEWGAVVPFFVGSRV